MTEPEGILTVRRATDGDDSALLASAEPNLAAIDELVRHLDSLKGVRCVRSPCFTAQPTLSQPVMQAESSRKQPAYGEADQGPAQGLASTT